MWCNMLKLSNTCCVHFKLMTLEEVAPHPCQIFWLPKGQKMLLKYYQGHAWQSWFQLAKMKYSTVVVLVSRFTWLYTAIKEASDSQMLKIFWKNSQTAFDLNFFVVLYCGFCLSRILLYFHMCVCVCHRRDMSIYANIYRFWALMPVYIIFLDDDDHLVNTWSLL